MKTIDYDVQNNILHYLYMLKIGDQLQVKRKDKYRIFERMA